jgi:hypothetical protein
VRRRRYPRWQSGERPENTYTINFGAPLSRPFFGLSHSRVSSQNHLLQRFHASRIHSSQRMLLQIKRQLQASKGNRSSEGRQTSQFMPIVRVRALCRHAQMRCSVTDGCVECSTLPACTVKRVRPRKIRVHMPTSDLRISLRVLQSFCLDNLTESTMAIFFE